LASEPLSFASALFIQFSQLNGFLFGEGCAFDKTSTS
jgi:hypothetical protein